MSDNPTTPVKKTPAKKPTGRKGRGKKPAVQRTAPKPVAKKSAPVKPTVTTIAVPERATAVAAPKAPGETKSSTVRLMHIEPWSAARAAFVVSGAISIVILVAEVACWIVMKITGVWGALDDALTSVVSAGGHSAGIGSFLGLFQWILVTVVLAVVNMGLFTLLAALGARIYNVVAQLVGGVQVTFSDE